jgi:RNA polymerase-interacting CarD/CdnL/TRCF family regulator
MRLTVLRTSAGISDSIPRPKGGTVEPLPDLGSLSDEGLKELIDDLEQQEREVSYERRLLHGKIDILRAELVARLQSSGGRSVLDQVDVDRLTDILAGKASPPA